MSEDQLQAQCYQWFHNEYPMLRMTLFSVPNGGTRNIREAQKLKATGVVKGVHDLIWFYKNHLTTFELKVGNNKLTTDQLTFKQVVESNGGNCYEIRDFDTFKKIINEIIWKIS